MSRRRPSRTTRECFTPWKRPYDTREAAEEVLDKIISASRHGLKIPTRSYQCPACLAWHLTSKE